MCHGIDGKGGVNAAVGRRRPAQGHGVGEDHRQLLALCHDPLRLYRRAMPWQQPKTLTNDEVYALTAYILALNKLIGENDEMNAKTLPKVKMPNRDGFIIRFPEKL